VLLETQQSPVLYDSKERSVLLFLLIEHLQAHKLYNGCNYALCSRKHPLMFSWTTPRKINEC